MGIGLGAIEGVRVGVAEGSELGARVGPSVGLAIGAREGAADGFGLGTEVVAAMGSFGAIFRMPLLYQSPTYIFPDLSTVIPRG